MKTNHHIHASPCATSHARHTSSTRFFIKLLPALAVSLFAFMLATPDAEGAFDLKKGIDKAREATGTIKQNNKEAEKSKESKTKAKAEEETMVEAEAKATASTTTTNTGATTTTTAPVKTEDAVSASVNSDNQDNVRRIKGFNIEFYKKLNPDDFAATDVPALRALFESIYKQTVFDYGFSSKNNPMRAGGDYRTFKLTVIEEPHQRPFEDLSATEGSQGGTWYTGARWRLNLHEEGLNNYLTVIVPKLRAVLSKAAVKASEHVSVYTVTSDRGNLVLERNLDDESDPIPDTTDGKKMVKICLAIPSAPEKLLNPKAGDRIPVKYIIYDLPAAFGNAVALKNESSVIWLYQHACARNGAYLDTKSSVSFDTCRPYGTNYPKSSDYTSRSIYENEAYNWLLYYCPSVVSSPKYWLSYENQESKHLVIQVEGRFPTFSVKDGNYGGVLVNFRSEDEMKKAAK